MILGIVKVIYIGLYNKKLNFKRIVCSFVFDFVNKFIY